MTKDFSRFPIEMEDVVEGAWELCSCFQFEQNDLGQDDCHWKYLPTSEFDETQKQKDNVMMTSKRKQG